MEGDSADMTQSNLKPGNRELEDECVKLKDVVDKMVFYFKMIILILNVCKLFIMSKLFVSKGKYTVKDGEDGPC